MQAAKRVAVHVSGRSTLAFLPGGQMVPTAFGKTALRPYSHASVVHPKCMPTEALRLAGDACAPLQRVADGVIFPEETSLVTNREDCE